MVLSKSPSASDIFNAARTQIFCEHGCLRARLGETLAVGDAAARGDHDAVAVLPEQVICCLSELKSHFGFEESVLVPLLDASGEAGKHDAAALLEMHRDQRQRLSALIEKVTVARPTPQLASDLHTLADDVFTDMAEEELKLIRGGALATQFEP